MVTQVANGDVVDSHTQDDMVVQLAGDTGYSNIEIGDVEDSQISQISQTISASSSADTLSDIHRWVQGQSSAWGLYAQVTGTGAGPVLVSYPGEAPGESIVL